MVMVYIMPNNRVKTALYGRLDLGEAARLSDIYPIH